MAFFFSFFFFFWIGLVTPRIFRTVFLTKSLLVSLGKLKFQSMFISFWGITLLLKLKINGRWKMDLLNVLEEVEWDYIHKANFTCTIETQLRSFYLKLFHRAICTYQFLHKIDRADNPNCYFAVVSLNLFYTFFFFFFFANVKKFLPSGMSYVSWLIKSLGKHLIFLILIRCLALLIFQNMIIVLISCFCVWNFTFTNANFSRSPLILMHFWISLKLKGIVSIKLLKAEVEISFQKVDPWYWSPLKLSFFNLLSYNK